MTTPRPLIFERSPRRGRAAAVTAVLGLSAAAALLFGVAADQAEGRALVTGPYTVLAYNDLGMHCMNEDFSELVILPPFNNLRAQVIRRGPSPNVMVEDDITLSFAIPTNTHSADKTNFWTYAEALFQTPLPPDVGLTGNGLAGPMSQTPNHYYEATGIPLTPIDDAWRQDPYPLATVKVTGPLGTGETRTVIPVSSEISCNLCHVGEGGQSVAHDILADHDALHGTTLVDQKPVLCAGCHADPALGTPGEPGLATLSSAVHLAHAPRMDLVPLQSACYACHPGLRTDCQRDVHLAADITCVDCHGGMESVGNPARVPWVSEPRCDDCHVRAGFEFEPPGTLFKDAVGHGGVLCASCHGSPHAVSPAVTETDNLQTVLAQGAPGPLDDCTVCHIQMPGEPFFHTRED